MIQRIQSVYLLLAGLVLAFSFCTPQIYFTIDGVLFATLTACGINAANVVAETGATVISVPWGVVVFMSLGALLAFVSLFMYKNRKRQIKLINLMLLSIVLVYISDIAYAYAFDAHHNTNMQGAWGVILPFAAYVLGWFARRAVRKDEELVRAADRIR